MAPHGIDRARHRQLCPGTVEATARHGRRKAEPSERGRTASWQTAGINRPIGQLIIRRRHWTRDHVGTALASEDSAADSGKRWDLDHGTMREVSGPIGPETQNPSKFAHRRHTRSATKKPATSERRGLKDDRRNIRTERTESRSRRPQEGAARPV